MIGIENRMQSPLSLPCKLNPELKKCLISYYEQLLLTRVFEYLRHFKFLTDALCSENYVTLPLIVIGFTMLVDKIEESILDQKNMPNR